MLESREEQTSAPLWLRFRSEDATSSEFDETTQHAVIYKLRDLLGVEEMGGTMRLGAYPCVLQEGTLPKLAVTVATGQGVNLLQGEFGRAPEYSAMFKPWKAAALSMKVQPTTVGPGACTSSTAPKFSIPAPRSSRPMISAGSPVAVWMAKGSSMTPRS